MNCTRKPRRSGQGLGGVLLFVSISLTAPVGAQHAAFSANAVSASSAPGAADQQARHAFSDEHAPRGALWRAAVVPGWGQLYNRQYLKIPLVYAGLGGIVGLALYNNGRYLLFRHAFQHKAFLEGRYAEGEGPPASYAEDYARALVLLGVAGGSVSSSELERIRDKYRRDRDLSYIGIGLVYGLTVLDAYVSAHLLDFDVGEDLTVSVRPAPGGVAAALHVGL